MELEGFELFKEHGRSFQPKISIRKRGQIGFNNGAINRCHLDKFDYARLYYNKVTKQIAFKFTNSEKEDSGNSTYRLDDQVVVIGQGLVLGVEKNIQKSSWLQDAQGRYICFLLVSYPDKLVKEMQRLNKGANVTVRPEGERQGDFFLN